MSSTAAILADADTPEQDIPRAVGRAIMLAVERLADRAEVDLDWLVGLDAVALSDAAGPDLVTLKVQLRDEVKRQTALLGKALHHIVAERNCPVLAGLDADPCATGHSADIVSVGDADLVMHLGAVHAVDITGLSPAAAEARHRREHLDAVGVRRHHPPAELHPWAGETGAVR